jgi:glycosyltransferase involved in cell wall biosynthesis
MTGLVAPGNDYRQLASLPEGDEPSISVVIPIYNRVELLDNVLAGLSAQDFDGGFEIIVMDDGSEEDVSAVCDRWSGSLDVRHVRQEHEGNGAASARNAGAGMAKGDLLVFLDADSIPSPNFISGHAG